MVGKIQNRNEHSEPCNRQSSATSTGCSARVDGICEVAGESAPGAKESGSWHYRLKLVGRNHKARIHQREIGAPSPGGPAEPYPRRPRRWLRPLRPELRGLRLSAIRKLSHELLVTAKAQRWKLD